jgi:hypothetical protein
MTPLWPLACTAHPAATAHALPRRSPRPEFLALIRELREDCAGLTSTGAPRSRKEVALALQRYLVGGRWWGGAR